MGAHIATACSVVSTTLPLLSRNPWGAVRTGNEESQPERFAVTAKRALTRQTVTLPGAEASTTAQRLRCCGDRNERSPETDLLVLQPVYQGNLQTAKTKMTAYNKNTRSDSYDNRDPRRFLIMLQW